MGCVSMGLRSGTGLFALVIGSVAAAQDTVPPDVPQAAAESSGGDIVVTGSRIRRDPLAQDSPIVFVDQADIAKTGLNSINDVLQRLPSAGGGFNGKFNNSGNFGNPPDGGGVGAGSAEIDLRYLGSKRTLVLVDGLRFVNAASASGVPGSVDLNAIPESMIERVEVLQDSASAIYGSDAIAGVVNIITKKSQDGLMASAQFGGYDEGDGFTQNYQISWGNGNDGPTQFVVGANFVKQDPISSGDRDISLFPEPFATACINTCSSGTPNGRFIVLGQDLTLIAPVPPGVTPTLADYRAWAGNSDRFNFAPYNFILTPLKRYGGFVQARHEFGPDISLSGKLVYNHRESKNQAAPLPLFVGPDAGNGNLLDRITIDASNPYNPFGTLESGFNLDGTPSGFPANYAFIGRRVVEGGPRRYNQKVDTWYGTGTLDRRFELFGHNWYWDVNGLYGRNKAKQTMFGNINAANLAQALGPIGACTGPCVPFNIFGGEGSITPAMLDFVGFIQNDSSKQELWGASANITGSILELPGGPLAIALGAEHRDYSGRFDPDEIIEQGLGSDIPALPTRGGYNVDELYAELKAPVLAHQPFAELLEFDAAARFSDYSRSGSTVTFKGGVNWKPIKDLRFRGSYSEGFRAPTIGELFGTPSRFDQEIDDPCSNDATPPTGQTATNCAAHGVPPGYTQLNAQISVITGGNEDLDPETSKSWLLGAVYSPSFIPRFSIEANWYKITVKGAIQAINANTILELCEVNDDAAACALYTRTVTGQIVNIQGRLQNIASIETKGLDVNLVYKAKTGFGDLGFTWNNSFLFNYDIEVPAAGGTTVISREGTEQGSPDQAFPKWKSNAILDWDWEDFGFSLTGRYIKGVTESLNGNKLGNRFYTDVQLRWDSPDFAKNFGFALGVNNLFDKDPPGCISCGLNNFDPGTYDVPGRYLYARATVKM